MFINRRPIRRMELSLKELGALQDFLQDAVIRLALPTSLKPLHRKLTIALQDATLPSLWERLHLGATTQH